MQRYVIHDNECGNFCEWSYDNPPSKIEIRRHFKGMSDDEGLGGDEPVPFKYFTFDFIQDIWNVRIQKLEEYQLERENYGS